MAFDLKGRRVFRFRCHLDPMIGPKPKMAFDKRDMPNCEFELTPIGVYVRIKLTVPGNPVQLQEHVVPYANIQSIMLYDLEAEDDKSSEKKK